MRPPEVAEPVACTCLSELAHDAYGAGGPSSGKPMPPPCLAHPPQPDALAKGAVQAIKDKLRGEPGEEWTDHGMEDVFFRWPIIERAILAALQIDVKADVRTCTCSPDERPTFCPQKYALSECTKADALVEENARLRAALKVADDAITEMFRYYDGGETRGSYDGKPERAQLRKAGYFTRAALATKGDG